MVHKIAIAALLLLVFSIAQGDAGEEPTTSGPPVPWHHLLASEHQFSAPPKEDVAHAFRVAHEISEHCYEGNGVWRHGTRNPPLVRTMSRRVLGYIGAYRALGEDVYKKRALEGLEYLLREQRPSGSFVWYHSSARGIDDRDNCLYEAGIAGSAFVEGYRLFEDERFLRASEKTARWAIECPVSKNNNYNMFAVWHLAAHYGLTGDQAFLDAAIHKTREGSFPEQFESGGWPGHNSWLWYHGIIIRGMAELYNVLPTDHPFRRELRPHLIAAMNRVVREQEASGRVPPNPAVGSTKHRMTFVLQGLLLARESFGSRPDNCIHGMETYRVQSQPTLAEVDEFKARQTALKAERAEAQKKVLNERVWSDDFESFRWDAEWTEMADGWFNAWYPTSDPDSDRVQWARNSTEQRSGRYCQEYTSTGANVFGGIGYHIRDGLLIPGHVYRFDVWTKCRESSGAKGSIELVHASAYSGELRPCWDCGSGCSMWNEEPTFHRYQKLSMRFTASEGTNYLYVWMLADPVPEGESVSLLVDDAELTHEGEPLPKWSAKVKHGDWDCDIMVTGLYLEKIFGRADSP